MITEVDTSFIPKNLPRKTPHLSFNGKYLNCATFIPCDTAQQWKWMKYWYTFWITAAFGNFAEWKRSILKGYILYYSIYGVFFLNDKITEMKNRRVIAKGACSQRPRWGRLVDVAIKEQREGPLWCSVSCLYQWHTLMFHYGFAKC